MFSQDKRLNEVEDLAKRAHEAMVRIGKESRTHGVLLEELQKRRYEDDVKTGVLQDTITELTQAVKEHSEGLRQQSEQFNSHLVTYSRNESNLTRQALQLYFWMGTSILGWGFLLFGDFLKTVLANG
jgi:hypothetical protein